MLHASSSADMEQWVAYLTASCGAASANVVLTVLLETRSLAILSHCPLICIREAVVDVATEGLKACSSSDVVPEACWLDTAQQILSVLVSQVQYKLIPPNLKTPGV